ncbi:MAG: hypothetical protein NXI27_28715 [Alphaproteobacteria bacterium]|nr:hypothetical protein [Alphaproteobacteria bacterium]
MPTCTTVPLRPPDVVMRLARLGSFHQSRLSFMRSLLRRMKRENWAFSRPVWRMDDQGVGVGVYTARGPSRSYSLVCFSHDLDPSKRSDRSIATEWDATFTLFDGVPDEHDLERLSHQVPRQEAGRVSDSEFSISRANRSVRLFEHVVASLAAGQQPDREKIDAVGYLMRTTAVYGSGKFGAASRDKLADRPEASQPFQLEMLSVYLIRAFTIDIVEHLAQRRAKKTAVRLDPSLRRRFGVGNATGLGMAPFLVAHPALINNWVSARETALARVRSLEKAGNREIARFGQLLNRFTRSCKYWNTTDQRQARRIEQLQADLAKLNIHIDTGALCEDHPWDRLYEWVEAELGLEAQELVVSLVIEPYGNLVDDLLDTMSVDERAHFVIDGAMTVDALQDIVQHSYGWALDIDFDDPASQEKYWYVSQNKLEPRVGKRATLAPLGDLEMPIAIGRDIAGMARALKAWPGTTPIAEFLLHHSEYRHLVRRAQLMDAFPYCEIRDNLLHTDALPLDMLRCKLSFFGATRFDPKSDRWTRITMFQHAPYPEDLANCEADDWTYAQGDVA